jgi:hypothetical protein
MNKLLIAAVLLMTAACTKPESILLPFADAPKSCENIDREMYSRATRIAKVLNLRQAKGYAIMGASIGIATAAIPPVGALLILLPAVDGYQIDTSADYERIKYLANVRIAKECKK